MKKSIIVSRRKSLLCWLLILGIVTSLFPLSAITTYALDAEITVGGVTLNSEVTQAYADPAITPVYRGETNVSTTIPEGKSANITYDADKRILTLTDAHIRSKGTNNIFSRGDITIDLNGNNTTDRCGEWDSAADKSYSSIASDGGITFTGDSISVGGQIGIYSDELTINGASVEAISNASQGGEAVEVNSLIVRSGSLDCTSEDRNALYAQNITMYSGSLSGESKYRLGISTSVLTMNGGSLSGISERNSGIYADAVTMNGGSISGLSAEMEGVAFGSDGVTLHKGSIIAETQDFEGSTAIYFGDLHSFSVSNLANCKMRTDKNEESYVMPHSIDELYTAASAATYFEIAALHNDHPVCGAICSDHTHDTLANWSEFDGTFESAGNYYLSEPTSITQPISIDVDGVTLCLNGYTLNCDDEIKIKSGATLNICNCCESGKIILDDMLVEETGTLNLYDGTIEAGASIQNQGALNIYGGEIIGSGENETVLNRSDGVLKIFEGKVAHTTANIIPISVIDSSVYLGSGALIVSNDAPHVKMMGDVVGSVFGSLDGQSYNGDTILIDTGEFPQNTIVVLDVENNSNRFKAVNNSTLIFEPCYNAASLYCLKLSAHEHYACGKDVCDCSATHAESILYKPWDAKTDITEPGNYFLIEDANIDDNIEITADANICLNGKTISCSEKQIIIRNDAVVSFCDCSESGTGSVEGENYFSIGAPENSAVINIYGGTYINSGNIAVGAYGEEDLSHPTINLYGGVFNGRCGVVSCFGFLNIYDGNLGGDTYAIEVKASNLNIYGGKMKSIFINDAGVESSAVAICGGLFGTDYSEEDWTTTGYHWTENTDNSTKTEFPYLVKMFGFTANVNLKKDGVSWSGQTVELKKENADSIVLPGSEGVYTKTGIPEDTYDVYVNGNDTGADLSDATAANIDCYTLSYNANGHGTSPNSVIVPSGARISKPTTPSETGYSLVDWYTDIDCDDEDKWDFATDTVTETTTLYAKWTEKTDTAYTVKHHKQNISGDGYDLADTDNMTGTTNADTAATAKGYDGFTVQSFDQEAINAEGTTVVDIYYTRNSYTLTIVYDNGIDDTVTSYKYGQTVASVANPTKTGYTFDQWSETIPSTMPANTVTVTAQWIGINYSIAFNANGGEGQMSNRTFSYNTAQNLIANEFTREDFSFSCWNTQSDGSGVSYADVQSIINLTETDDATITLYAMWQRIGNYSISGEVKTDGIARPNITVKLMLGNIKIAETTTDENGHYTFTNISPDNYNVVAMLETSTKTIWLTVTDANKTDANILAFANRSSVLELSLGAPNVVVGGLDEIAENTPGTENIIIKLNVSNLADDENDIEQTKIKELTKNQQVKFIRISLTKTVGLENPVDIGDVNEQIVRISIPFDMSGLRNFKIYRYHNGQAKLMPLGSAHQVDGEYYEVGENRIIVSAKKFSTYAIGYANSSPSRIGGAVYCTVDYNTDGGNAVPGQRVEMNSVLNKPTEPIKEGYKFEGWYVDKALTAQYDFSQRIIQSMTLYAKWSKIDAEPAEWENPFVDVDKDNWFYDVVKSAYIGGLINGVTETTFEPSRDITRAMFAQIIYRMENKPRITEKSPFLDVKTDAYYSDAIDWNYQNAIIKGISSVEFAPEAPITREQMATMLFRYAQVKGIVSDITDALTYTDTDKISEYAIPAIGWASGVGVINGNADGSFAPQDKASRAEAVAVFVRLLNIVEQ